jgi:hypothetical protein
MLNSSNTLPSTNFDLSSLPTLFNSDQSASTDEKAKKIHRFLLDLAKSESEKEMKSFFRQTADFFRDTVFGKSEKQIRSCIINVLEDYFDGENYVALEIENIAEESSIRIEALQPVLDNMVKKGEILQGKRRRFQEAGKHFNPIYKLKTLKK